MEATFDPIALFLAAGPVVRMVMAGLFGASILVWAIWAGSALRHMLLRRRLRADIVTLSAQDTLNGVTYGGAVATLIALARHESAVSVSLPAAGTKERTSLALLRAEARMARNAQSGAAVIGSIGALAPFVGLFGTVWGIMHSFTGIAASGSSNLAVVAPGIAEALLATAIGLGAAIPAVALYNHLARSAAATRALLSDAVALVLAHLSRDLDRAALQVPQHTPRLHAAE